MFGLKKDGKILMSYEDRHIQLAKSIFDTGRETVPWLLAQWAESRADSKFLIWIDEDDNESSYSYEEFQGKVQSVASGLAQRSLSKGDKVLIHLKNSPEFLISWFACAELGLVSILCNPAYNTELIEHCFNLSKAKAVITSKESVDLFTFPLEQGVAFFVAGLAGLESGEPFSGPREHLAEPWESLLQNTGSPSLCQISPLDPVTVIFTSGTTGKPKGVVWTHLNALNAGRENSRGMCIAQEDVAYCSMPMHHVMALSYCMLTTFSVGGGLVMRSLFDPASFWAMSAKYQCSWAVLAGYEFPRLEVSSEPHTYKLWYTTHAEPKFGEKYSVGTIGGFGMSELTRPVILSQRFLPQERGVIGWLDPGVPIKIVDEEGQEVGLGKSGDMLVRGVRGVDIFLEYLNNPEATKQAFDPEGWFVTGDVVRVGSDGALFFVERKGDMIKVAGENVATVEIEKVIWRVDGVVDVAVVGKIDPDLGEVPVAFVIFKGSDDGTDPSDPARFVMSACREKLPQYMVPQEIIFVDELPRSQLQKVAKNRLRDYLAERKNIGQNFFSDVLNDSMKGSSLSASVSTLWCDVLGVKSIGLDDGFVGFGGNSLMALRIVGTINRELGFSMGAKEVFEYSSVRKLAARLEILLAASLISTPSNGNDFEEIIEL